MQLLCRFFRVLLGVTEVYWGRTFGAYWGLLCVATPPRKAQRPPLRAQPVPSKASLASVPRKGVSRP